MEAFLGILGIFIFGFLIADNLVKNSHVLEKLSLSFILGLGVYTFVLFLINIVGIPLNTLSVSVALALLIAALLAIDLLGLRRNPMRIFLTEIRSLKFSFGKWEWVLLASISFLILTSLIAGLYWPVRDWDALTLYDFRGKVIAQTGSITSVFFSIYYLAYPLLTSLAHTFLYLMGGNPPIIYPLFYTSFLGSFYFLIRRFSSRLYSILFVLLLSVSSDIYNHSLISYTNLPYTVYLTLGFFYLIYFARTKVSGYAFLSALLVGLSTWTRSDDPFWMLLCFLILIVGFTLRKKIVSILYILIVFIFRFSWGIFREIYVSKLPISSSGGALGVNYFSRIWEVVLYLYQNVVDPYKLLFLLFALIVIYNFKKPNVLAAFVIIFIFLILATLFVGIYYVSLFYSKWEIVGGSVTRMSMIFVPVILFLAALEVQRFFQKKEK